MMRLSLNASRWSIPWRSLDHRRLMHALAMQLRLQFGVNQLCMTSMLHRSHSAQRNSSVRLIRFPRRSTFPRMVSKTVHFLVLAICLAATFSRAGEFTKILSNSAPEYVARASEEGER